MSTSSSSSPSADGQRSPISALLAAVVLVAIVAGAMLLLSKKEAPPTVGQGVGATAPEVTPPAQPEPEPVPPADSPLAEAALPPPAPPQGDGHKKPIVLDSFGRSHRPACGEGWYTPDVKAAEEKAKSLGLTLLLIFEKDDCEHCQEFNDIMLADPEMAEIMRSPQLVVAKRFYDQWDKARYDIKATPTFLGIEFKDGQEEIVEYLPGLLQLELMKKRFRDLAAGRGRLGRTRSALREDPDDMEALKILLDEYLDVLNPREKIDKIKHGLEVDPKWTHGIALLVWTLIQLEQQGNPSAGRMLEELTGAAQAKITKGIDDAQSHFTVGYTLMARNQMDQGIASIEKCLELDKADCEAYCHLAYGYTWQAAKLQQAGDLDGARQKLMDAERAVRQAQGYCPGYALAEKRQMWIDEQWGVLGLQRQ